MRQSLYRQSDDELSLIVFNTEYLYNIRHKKALFRILRADYQFTNKQLAVLKADLKDDLEETNNYNLENSSCNI